MFLTDPAEAIYPERPVITLPDKLPEGVAGGTIETPAGPARWAYLEGPAGSLPYPFATVLPWGDGIANWDGYHRRLHTTRDGLTWERVDALPAVGSIALVGETYVVVDVENGRAMTSTDPEGEWAEIDASAIAAARLPGWANEYEFLRSGPMLIDDRIVFSVHYSYTMPKAALGISPDGTKNLRSLPDGRYVLCSAGARSSCGTDGKWILRIKETPEGLVVRHDRTGKRLGLIKGASADQIYKGERGSYRRLFAIEGDTVVEIDSPWPGLSNWQAAIRTVAPGGTEPVLLEWAPNRGVRRSALGVPAIVDEIAERDRLWVSPFWDRLAAYSFGGSGEPSRAWVSSNGVDWTPAPNGAPEGAEVRWSGSGWVAGKRQESGTGYWMHMGGKWIALDQMGLEWVGEPRGIGNLTLFTSGDSENHKLWVLTHPVETE
jgi:hypothetical protein